MSMFHDLADHVRVPTTEDKIFKDECALSFDSPELKHGIYICLCTFVAIGHSRLQNYCASTGRRAFLQYKIDKRFKYKSKTAEERPTKLALGVPGGFELPQDRYMIVEHWFLVRMPEGERLELPNPAAGQLGSDTSHLDILELPPILAGCISAVQCADSAILAEERASATAAWEEENVCIISRYAMDLVQLDNGVTIAPSGWKCAKCGMKENLWLNLTDGAILCGRRFWDGSGGNNHAIEHYENTQFPLAVKLGTITPKGAEVFSYAEDEMVTDPLLAEHLAHFGIDVMRMEKTDKTVAELEVAANERLGEWLMLQEADRTLEPRYGPGFTGLRNLGNSCYLNAIVQVLFAIPSFRWYYAYRLPYWSKNALQRTGSQSELLVDDVNLQMAKLGGGLCSGAYSWLLNEDALRVSEGPVPLFPGIRPMLFRRLIGKNHAEFATKRQQDAFEFFIHLLGLLENESPNGSTQAEATIQSPSCPVNSMRLLVEDRLECGLTHKVCYTTHSELALSLPVPLEAATNKEAVAEYELRLAEAEADGVRIPPEEVVRPCIPLSACLSAWAATELVEDFATPASQPPGTKTHALRSSRLLNFPDYLCIQIGKFAIGPDWLPRKLDVEISLGSSVSTSALTSFPEFQIDLSMLRSPGGLQAGETPMPDPDKCEAQPESSGQVPATTTHATAVQPDSSIVNQLMEMGFSAAACHKACISTSNQGIEAASNWLMEHMDDDDFDSTVTEPPSSTHFAPALPASSNPVSVGPSEESIQMLTAMGFTQSQAVNALLHTANQLEAAADWLLCNPDAPAPAPPPLSESVSRIHTQISGDVGSTTASVISATTRPKVTDGRSIYEVFAFVSHMGKSTTDGHYVAHIKRSALSKGIPNESPIRHGGSAVSSDDHSSTSESNDEWIIFNDEKVAKSEAPPHQHAYLYYLRRLDAPSE